MMHVITAISTWIIPIFILVVLLTVIWKKVPKYERFVEGGKEGIKMAFSLLPFLVGMIDSRSRLRGNGALEAFVLLMSPSLCAIDIAPEIIPLALVRAISGTAALGMTTELISTHGPDSFIGRLASTMQGSTDTTLYIITVYFGAVGIKKTRYAVKVGLLADVIGILASILIVTIIFT